MNCQQSRELMMDILYGEEENSDASFSFIDHLKDCYDCDLEYRELIKTREWLQRWELPGQMPEEDGPIVDFHPTRGVVARGQRARLWYWTGVVSRVAAMVLMVLGAVSLLRSAGVIAEAGNLTVSEEELATLVNDMVIAKQNEDWNLFARAMMGLKEDIDLQRRQDMNMVYEDLGVLERRYLTVWEQVASR